MEINLNDEKSINNGIKSLKEIANELRNKMNNKIVDKFVDICYEKCLSNLDEADKYPSTQFRNIKSAIGKVPAKDGIGYVKLKQPAIYVELGTGLNGKNGTKHPMATDIGWNPGSRKEKWIYPTDEGASNPMKFQTENGDWLAFTRGQKARPFAYNAYEYTKQSAKGIINAEIQAIFKESGD